MLAVGVVGVEDDELRCHSNRVSLMMRCVTVCVSLTCSVYSLLEEDEPCVFRLSPPPEADELLLK